VGKGKIYVLQGENGRFVLILNFSRPGEQYRIHGFRQKMRVRV